jgi:hypothetical protein
MGILRVPPSYLKMGMEGKRAERFGFPLLCENSAPFVSVRYLSVFLLNTEVTENSHDSDWWTISDCAGHMCVGCRGAEDWAERGGEEAGGLREYCDWSRIDLPMEGKTGAGARGSGGDEDCGGAVGRAREGSEAKAQLRSAGICRGSHRGGIAGVFKVDWGERAVSGRIRF